MEPTPLSKKIIFSCFLASFLEIYDFAIFGFFLNVLHKNYLSFLSETSAVIISYAFFAIGFLFRPLGSLIFGYIGDTYGRKTSLVTSVTIMGFASFAMFILPPYQMIGVASCFLIVLIRILQGVSVGGEFTGALVFVVEHNRNNKAGFVAGIVTAGGACGVLLANLVSKIVQNPALPDYSWRFAFLIGFGLSLVGFFIRRRISDTPVFIESKRVRIPLFEGLKSCKIESFATLCVAAANGTTFYFGTVYLYQLLKNNRTDHDFDFVPILVSIIVAALVPFFGSYSDKINRKLFLSFSALLMGLYCVFGINLIVEANSVLMVAIYVAIYAFLAAMMIGSINIFTIEIFPPAYRMSCSSLFYSLGMGFIGGTVPMVASYLKEAYNESLFYIGLYIALVCFAASISVLLVYIKHLKVSKYFKQRLQ